ncbi:hypothetical protein CsSME_00040523 [Camellia sinensis var. sinensis]
MQGQTISIGNIPLMNSLGTSIINGTYRIVINQILQCPGIYYRSELDHNGISVYTELEIDRKARIWAWKKNLGQKKMPFWSNQQFVGRNSVFSESLCKEIEKKFFKNTAKCPT